MKKIKNSLQAMGALLALSLLASPVSGAPITFAFEAHVDRVPTGIPFDSGIDFGVGDTVSGRFTFDPSEGDGGTPFSALQPYEFSLDINGTVVIVPQFILRSWNDNAITDFSPANQVDDLYLFGGGLVDESGMPFPNIEPAISGFKMSLWGPDDIFDQASISASASIWNALNLERQLIVALRDSNGGVIGFQATVRSFEVVPEPSAFLSMTFASIAIIFGYRLHRILINTI